MYGRKILFYQKKIKGGKSRLKMGYGKNEVCGCKLSMRR